MLPNFCFPKTPVPSRTGHATDRVLIYLDTGSNDATGDGKDKVQKNSVFTSRVMSRWRSCGAAPYIAEKHQRSTQFEFWKST